MNKHKVSERWIIPIVLFSISFLCKFYYIDTRDVCLDEPFTIFHTQKSIVDILRLPAQNEPNPPLFMLILHFWIKLFGIGVYSVRILPLIFNSLTAILLYFTGRKLVNVWGGIISSGLFILSTYHFYFGLETRTYSLLSMATAGALYSFLSLIDNPDSKKNIISLIVWNMVLIYSHYFGFFVVFVQAIISCLYLKNKKFLISTAAVLTTTCISFIPMGVVFVRQFLKSKEGTWVAPPSKTEYLNQLKLFLNATVVLKITLIICLIAFVWLLLQKPKKEKLKTLIALFLWWFVPYTIMFLVSFKVPMFINRYILFNTIGIFVFIGALIAFSFKRNQLILFLIIALLFSFMYKKLEINSKQFYYREVQKSVEHLKTYEDTNSIVLIHPQWASKGFMYYFDQNLFAEVTNYDTILKRNNIFPVWDIHHSKKILDENKDKKVLYYQDASLFIDKNNTIFNYLDATHTRIDSVFFPECIYVSVFIPKDSIK